MVENHLAKSNYQEFITMSNNFKKTIVVSTFEDIFEPYIEKEYLSKVHWGAVCLYLMRNESESSDLSPLSVFFFNTYEDLI